MYGPLWYYWPPGPPMEECRLPLIPWDLAPSYIYSKELNKRNTLNKRNALVHVCAAVRTCARARVKLVTAHGRVRVTATRLTCARARVIQKPKIHMC